MKKKVEANGTYYSVDISGNGESVILLHGITTNSFIWKEIAEQLSKQYTVYAFDLLGCGDSDISLDVDYSIKNQAELLFSTFKKLGVSKAHFVAHDVGGGIAQLLAVKHPDVFYDLTLINTIAYDFWPVQPIIAMRTPIVRQLAISTLDAGMLKLIIKRGLYNKERLKPDLFAQFKKQMNTREKRKAFLHFANSLNNKDLTDITNDLKNIQFPVQIIRGDGDVYLSKAISERLHSDIPNSTLHILDQAGHFAMIDAPEMVLELIQNFIGKTNG